MLTTVIILQRILTTATIQAVHTVVQSAAVRVVQAVPAVRAAAAEAQIDTNFTRVILKKLKQYRTDSMLSCRTVFMRYCPNY